MLSVVMLNVVAPDIIDDLGPSTINKNYFCYN
jgi:hypothetical protein